MSIMMSWVTHVSQGRPLFMPVQTLTLLASALLGQPGSHTPYLTSSQPLSQDRAEFLSTDSTKRISKELKQKPLESFLWSSKS